MRRVEFRLAAGAAVVLGVELADEIELPALLLVCEVGDAASGCRSVRPASEPGSLVRRRAGSRCSSCGVPLWQAAAGGSLITTKAGRFWFSVPRP